jgi:hypothetical protein
MKLQLNHLRVYGRRIRAQGVRRTLRDVTNPGKVVRHTRRLLSGAAASNPYLPSFSPEAEARFAASLTGRNESEVEKAFVELDADREFVGGLKESYATVRVGHELHIGRFHVLYALVRLIRPKVILETGVHDGLSSAVMLRALDRNADGYLVSIDLPSTDLPADAPGPGWLVPDNLRARWQLHLGDARDLLPPLAIEHAPIGLFFHDSDHSQEHQEFEFRTVKPHMVDHGVVMSDQDYPFDSLMGTLSTKWRVEHYRVRTEAGQPGGFMGGLALSPDSD